MAKQEAAADFRYCRECKGRLQKTAGGDLIYCCPMGVDREEHMGDVAAFECANGKKFPVPLLPLQVERLLPDTAELLNVLMQKFGGCAWERDVLVSLRWRIPRYAKALSDLVFRREGYRVADNAPTQDFRIFVTDLAADSWLASRGVRK